MDEGELATGTRKGAAKEARRAVARTPGAGIRQVVLVTLAVAVALQTIRVLLVLVSDFGERSGNTSDALLAGVLALAVFVAPIVAPLWSRALGERRSLVGAIVSLAALRVAIQVVHPVPLWLGAVAAAAAVVALTLLLRAVRGVDVDGGAWRYLVGLLLGLTVDTALRAGYRTWDPAWHGGTLALVLAVLPAVALVSLLLGGGRSLRVAAGGATVPRSLAAVGPFLMLQVLFLQSPAFVASASRLSLMEATAVVLVGDAMALATAATIAEEGVARGLPIAGGAAAVAIAYLLTVVDGPGNVPLVLVSQVLAALFLSMAFLRSPRYAERRWWRASSTLALAGTAFTLLVFLYQIHYRITLPLSNTFLPPVAAFLLALAGTGYRGESFRGVIARRAALVTIPVALLLVPLGVGLSGSAPLTATGGGSFRLISYNVHLAVNRDGQLDPEGIARAIEREDPDVVALQEVGRGWVLGGTVDLAEWLADRLDMAYAYAPAADGQFGNVVLSRLPILRSEAALLPKLEASMHRSYLLVEIDLGGGTSATVIDTHLEGDDPDQAAQVGRLLEAWGGTSGTIIAGDMNMQPDDPARARFDNAGLISVQDAAGHAGVTTATEPKFPGDRVDWIFVTDELAFSDFRVGQTMASDHLPLAVTVTVP